MSNIVCLECGHVHKCGAAVTNPTITSSWTGDETGRSSITTNPVVARYTFGTDGTVAQ